MLAALLVALGAAASTAGADTPDPILPSNVTLVVNADGTRTLTVSGTWQWTTHRTDCNTDRYAVGWAVDWNDPDQPGNLVGKLKKTPIDVGAAWATARNPADNAVHYYPGPLPPRCGVFGLHGGSSYNTGSWGPISHTYAAGTSDIKVCVVMYDIHNASKPHGPHPKKGAPPGPIGPKASDLIAGGKGHNHDNSVQDNENTPLGNQCLLTSVPPSTTTTAVDV